MPPAHQGLHADDAPAGDLDARLVVDQELLALERLAQAGLERQALEGLGVHRRGVEADRLAPVLARAVGGGLGAIEQLARPQVLLGVGGDAHARPERQRLALDREGVGQGVQQAPPGLGRVLDALEPLDQEAELAAADARDGRRAGVEGEVGDQVRIADALAQAPGHGRQQVRGAGRGQAVGQLAEAIELEVDQRDARAVGQGLLGGPRRPRQQLLAVRQARGPVETADLAVALGAAGQVGQAQRQEGGVDRTGEDVARPGLEGALGAAEVVVRHGHELPDARAALERGQGLAGRGPVREIDHDRVGQGGGAGLDGRGGVRAAHDPEAGGGQRVRQRVEPGFDPDEQHAGSTTPTGRGPAAVERPGAHRWALRAGPPESLTPPPGPAGTAREWEGPPGEPREGGAYRRGVERESSATRASAP